MGTARLAAATLLMEICEARRTLDDALGLDPSYKALKGPDRAFARAMVSAALRQFGRINIGLSTFLDRPLDTAPPLARALLQIGAAQLWIMDTAPHAAVSETVGAAKQSKRAQRAAGLLNAVLRKAAADRSAFDSAPTMAIWPEWLERAMVDSLGEAAATDLARAQMTAPTLDLTPKSGDAPALANRLGGDVALPGSVRLPVGAVEDLDGYQAGEWWVQDVAATLPARLLSPEPGALTLDLCAAPGGKTLQLAAAGAKVIALDRAAKRMTRLIENLGRVGLSDRAETVTAKVEDWAPPTPAPYILLDAPCSAMGTLRRHPEGAWIKSANDIARFPDVQARLLARAADMLAPGGTLVYCVCSPLRAEGIDVVERELVRGRLKRLPVTNEDVPGFEHSITETGDVLTLPEGDRQHDAFFIARLTTV